MFKERPDDKNTKRQQDMLDQSLLEEMGSEDDWKYAKDITAESHDSFLMVDDTSSIDGGPPPPSPRPLPHVPPPPSCASAIAGLADGREYAGQLLAPKINRADRIHEIVNTVKNMDVCMDNALAMAVHDGRTIPLQASDTASRDIMNQMRNVCRPGEDHLTRTAVAVACFRQGIRTARRGMQTNVRVKKVRPACRGRRTAARAQ